MLDALVAVVDACGKWQGGTKRGNVDFFNPLKEAFLKRVSGLS